MTALVLALMMAGAVLTLALMLLLLGGDHRTDLELRLSGFGLEDEPESADEDSQRHDPSLAETRFMQEMVGLTGRLADRVGLLSRVEAKLVQADVPLRPPEALFFAIAGVLLVVVGSAVTLSVLMAVVTGILAVLAPLVVLEIRRKRRLRRFERQLPDVLNLLAGSMRAGFSFTQGLEAVADEATEPSRRELQRVFTESRLGRPIEDALEDSAHRMHSVDLLWAVMAIRIQREVGGNLAELLDTVARTMTERERLKSEILSLTAEGRLSGWVLGVFPPAFGCVLFLIQPDYMKVLFQDSLGIIAVVVSAIMAGFGFVWLRRIMAIEV
ncbi:MAG: type II secretion system F family protein [Acidimicrobiia bacterium]